MELGTPLPGYTSRATEAPQAANDNNPQHLEIFDWKASRFVGDPEPVEYLVGGVIESGICSHGRGHG